MDRRRFAVGVIGALAGAPFAARAQRAAAKRIAVLIPFVDDAAAQAQVAAFGDELRHLGWTEGRNLLTEVRWSKGDLNPIRRHAKELVASAPDLIVSRTTPVTAALLAETRSIPIVFVVVSDPVGDRFVSSLARPGGNVTGFTNVEATLGGKWVDLLRQVKPDLGRVGVFYGPKTAPGGGTYYLRMVEAACRSVSIPSLPLPITDESQLAPAIAELAGDRKLGFVVTPDVTTATNRKTIIRGAAQYKIPAICPASYYADEGALIAYGIDYVDQYRRAAGYADRILRGARPGDLPVQAPSKFEMVVNLRAAKALGIDVPDGVLLRADRVIGR